MVLLCYLFVGWLIFEAESVTTHTGLELVVTEGDLELFMSRASYLPSVEITSMCHNARFQCDAGNQTQGIVHAELHTQSFIGT